MQKELDGIKLKVQIAKNVISYAFLRFALKNENFGKNEPTAYTWTTRGG